MACKHAIKPSYIQVISMNKNNQFLIALFAFFLSLLLGNLPSLISTSTANSLTKIEPPKATTVTTSPTNSHIPNIGDVVYDFAAEDETGQQRTFGEFRGTKPVLIYFYAGGCGHCMQMLPKLQQNELLYRAKSLGFQIMGVEFYGTPENSKRISETYGLPSPILADRQGKICGQLGVGEFTIFIVGADSVLYFRDIMNGSNWPTDNLLKEIVNKPTKSATTIAAPNSTSTVSTLQQIKTVETVENANPLNNNPFFGTILDKNLEAQKSYKSIKIAIISFIILLTIMIVSNTKGSWLPVLAISQFLLIATINNLWLYPLINLFVLGITVCMLKKDRLALYGTSTALIALFLLFFSNSSLFSYSNKNYVALSPELFFQTTWHIFPAAVLSMLMIGLSLQNQKQIYSKFSYTGNTNYSPEPFAEGVMAIKGISKAERCDICHQTDKFDLETGYCHRCQTKTN